MGPRTRSAPTWFFLLLAGCAGASALPRAVSVEPGKRMRVWLQDDGRAFVLQNQSSGPRNEVYQDTHGDALTKVVRDEALQNLLDMLAAHGMFARTTSAPTPGARGVIAVESPTRTWYWSRPVATPEALDEIRVFEEGRAYVMSVYNSEPAYRTGSIESFPPEVQRRIREEQARAAGQGSDQ